MPTPRMPVTSRRLGRKALGLTHTSVLPLRTAMSTRKYTHAAQLDRNVAKPAPAAPIPKPRMQMGSRMMLSRQPLMVPMLAWSVAPSERNR